MKSSVSFRANSSKEMGAWRGISFNDPAVTERCLAHWTLSGLIWSTTLCRWSS